VKALSAITGPWHQAALAAGWNPLYGRDLVTALQRAGLDQVAGRAHRSYQPGGDAWAGTRLGVERMRDQIRHAGASCADLDEALAAPGRPHPDHHGRTDRHRLGPAHQLTTGCPSLSPRTQHAVIVMQIRATRRAERPNLCASTR
jgi:hypothetical protein